MKELLKKLIRAKSTAEQGELKAAEVIEKEFAASGIKSQIDSWDNGRCNLFASIGSPQSGPAILFASHLDVVPAGDKDWQQPPFSPVEKQGVIYGRGAADMKGPIAAAVSAIKQIVEQGVQLKGQILFFAGAGEETDSCGTKKFMKNRDSQIKPAGVIITEPTNFDVVIAHRGILWLEMETKGKPAHSSTPQLGVNAIKSMQVLLEKLDDYQGGAQQHEKLGHASMSVNKIEGGEAMNIVPQSCRVGVDIRTIPEQNHKQILADFSNIIDGLKTRLPNFDARLRVLRTVDALETNPTCDFIRKFCSAVQKKQTKAVEFTTDGPYFAAEGTPVVVFGPGKSDICHKTNEYISINDLEKGCNYYKNIILRFCAEK